MTVISSHVLETILLVHEVHGLPVPITIDVDGSRIHLTLGRADEVDAWARHLGIPRARSDAHARYGITQFFPGGGGWCGATTITLWSATGAPAEVTS